MNEIAVLIVEDDTIARIIFKKLLTRLGYTALEAVNGEQALEMIDSHPEITHVFLDLNMPILDGYEFLKFINSGKKTRNVEIFITSVSEFREFEEEAAEKNVDTKFVSGYNKKPYDMARIANCLPQINNVLNNK
ncbi:MAG: response regulator [Chitinophagia bacterium]|nr:response regulator [Chitinophagia bacterium]